MQLPTARPWERRPNHRAGSHRLIQAYRRAEPADDAEPPQQAEKPCAATRERTTARAAAVTAGQRTVIVECTTPPPGAVRRSGADAQFPSDRTRGLTDASIPPIVLSGLVEMAYRHGTLIESWFEGTGLDPDRLLAFDITQVSYVQVAAVLRRALRTLPPGPWGMRLGKRDVLVSMGMLGVALSACATLADALALGSELHVASGSLVDIEFEISEGEVVLNLRQREPDPELTVFLSEEALCTALTFVRTMLGANRSPLSVELAYAPPAYAHEYTQFFRCPVEFHAEVTRLRFPASLLGCRLPHPHEPTRTVAAAACRQLINLHNFQPDIVAAIETLLEEHTRTPLTMTAVARHLHLTERTLRRQLSSAGDSFSTVRDRVRERTATILLRESALTIDAIAREVGFSNGREFRRAYTRWTGQPPSMVRQDKTGARE